MPIPEALHTQSDLSNSRVSVLTFEQDLISMPVLLRVRGLLPRQNGKAPPDTVHEPSADLQQTQDGSCEWPQEQSDSISFILPQTLLF